MNAWKPLPLPFKILSIVLLLWASMSIMVIITMPDREITFFGFLLSGITAKIIVLLLDFVSPLLFLYAMWKKLNWGANFGMLYNGIFILNSFIALFLFKDIFGNAIYFPLVASIIFFIIIPKLLK
jgi:hypothetical protein